MSRLVSSVLGSLLALATVSSLVACSGGAGGKSDESGSDAGEVSALDTSLDASADVSTDASTEASAAPSADGGVSNAAAIDAGTCAAVDPGTIPSGEPGQASAACTADEITAIASQVDAANSTLLATIQQTSASCQSCAVTASSAQIWGAFVEVSPTLVMLDQGACVAQVDSDCGDAINALFLCQQMACASCTDAASSRTCASDALQGVCADLALDATCQGATIGTAASCFPGNGVSDVQLAENILTLQCGSM